MAIQWHASSLETTLLHFVPPLEKPSSAIIWKLHIPSKLKCFLCLCLNECLTIIINLRNKGIQVSSFLPLMSFGG